MSISSTEPSTPIPSSTYTSTRLPPPIVDANGNFSKGSCPNADALNSIYKDGLISKPDCVERCVTSVAECNNALGTNVSRIETCNYAVCEKPRHRHPHHHSSSQPIVRPHNEECKSGQFCKECCIGKCLVDEQTLNMTCFLNCIDDVCTEKVVSTVPSSTGVGNTNPKPDVFIPISVPVDIQPAAAQHDSDAIWIFLLVMFGLVILGLVIFIVRNKRLHKLLKS